MRRLDNRFQTAGIDPRASVDETATVWPPSQVREFAAIGSMSTVGRGCYIGIAVIIGSKVKVQNSALIYEPAVIEDGAFIGPGVIFTNDHNPRSVNPDFSLKAPSQWKPVGVHVCEGASIAAGSICVAPVRIGRWAMVGAGSVVTSDVPDFALVVGTPARRIGWVGRAGVRLAKDPTNELWICPETGESYCEKNGVLEPIGSEL